MTIYIDTETGNCGNADHIVFVHESDAAAAITEVGNDSEITAYGKHHGVPVIPVDTLLQSAHDLLGDGMGNVGDHDTNEYTRGQVELLRDILPHGYLPSDDSDGQKQDVITLIRQRGTQTIYIVDQQGATHWFREKPSAERYLIDEAWRGATHLTIVEAQAPAYLDGDQLSDWAVAHARSSDCDH